MTYVLCLVYQLLAKGDVYIMKMTWPSAWVRF